MSGPAGGGGQPVRDEPVGVIGGLGPAATVHFLHRVVQLTDAHRDRTLVESREDPAAVLRNLVRERGVSAVLVECGGRLAANLLEAGLVDEWVAFLAPLLGGGPVPAVAGAGFPDGLRLQAPEFRRVGSDVMLRAEIHRG